MTKPRYINGEVLVPRPNKKSSLGKSFFIGRVAWDTPKDTTQVNIQRKDNIKQPHLDRLCEAVATKISGPRCQCGKKKKK